MNAFTIFSFLLFYVAFYLNVMLTVKFFIHIYQFCKYDSKLYNTWMKDNTDILLPRALISLVPVAFITLNPESGIIIAGIIYIISAYFYKKPDYAKELKINGKTKNICFIIAVIYILIMILALLFINKIVFLSIIFAVSYMLIPVFVWISAKILKLQENIM